MYLYITSTSLDTIQFILCMLMASVQFVFLLVLIHVHVYMCDFHTVQCGIVMFLVVLVFKEYNFVTEEIANATSRLKEH